MNTPCRPIALAVALWLGSPVAHAEPASGPCRAEQVVDGRTAHLRCSEGTVRVRLAGVTTPAPGETGYGEATRALRALLHGRELFVAFETPGRPTLDRDGAVRAYLTDRAGQSMNVALVALGWASHEETGDDEAIARRFEIAERDARSEQRAMWSVWAYTVGRGEPRDSSER